MNLIFSIKRPWKDLHSIFNGIVKLNNKRIKPAYEGPFVIIQTKIAGRIEKTADNLAIFNYR